MKPTLNTLARRVTALENAPGGTSESVVLRVVYVGAEGRTSGDAPYIELNRTLHRGREIIVEVPAEPDKS